MTAAKLPNHLYERGVEEGQSTWTVPWAMRVTNDGSLWLSSALHHNSHYGGTVCLKATLVAGGWEVELYSPTFVNTGPMRDERHLYRKQDFDEDEARRRGLLPVVKFTDRQGETP